jgi:hypothetical protein
MNNRPAQERRLWPRRAASGCRPVIGARVRPGRDVRLVDLSQGGALIEGATRLLPGSIVELQLLVDNVRHELRGTVVRSVVKALDHAGRVHYRAAVCFEGAVGELEGQSGSAFPEGHQVVG